ncbi:MAG: DUF3576 domain-containing protein [Alphaproteobacteria bacterium]
MLVLTACGGIKTEGPGEPQTTAERRRDAQGKLFGEDAFTLSLGESRRGEQSAGAAGIGVNSFLWRASLDTLSFLPLASADPFGGVIITDWYAPPESPDERFKVTVFILGRELRSDGIRASVFRQRLETDRGWTDASVDRETPSQLEDAILTRARQLRIQSSG